MKSLFILLSYLYFSPPVVTSTALKLAGKHSIITEFQQDDKFPVPADNVSRLFYVQRNPNTNTIIYELNNKDGHLDTENPIHVYWIKYADKGQLEELNYIQRKLAY